MFREQPLSELVRALKPLLRRPVTDKTGLAGNLSFDLTIAWPTRIDDVSDAAPDALTTPTDLEGAASDGPLVTSPSSVVSPIVERILAVTERQLGLKVVLRKGRSRCWWSTR